MDRRSARLRVALLTWVVIVALPAAPVMAANDPAVVDCTTHNALTRHYPVAQLQHALATMSAEVKEYTSCGDVIQRALDSELSGLHVSGGGGSGGGGSGGGSFLPLPVIIVLVVLLLSGVGYGAVQVRRRSESGSADEPPPRVQGP
jgi:hypothetical protein